MLLLRAARPGKTFAAIPEIRAVRTRGLASNASASVTEGIAAAQLQALKNCDVQGVEDHAWKKVSSIWSPEFDGLNLLVFLTHWADLGSWELAQRLIENRADLEAAGVRIVTVGLGTSKGGREFSKLTGYPLMDLYADPTSACYKALDFSPGFMGSSDLNGYIKVFPMLAGIGSPGTMQEVLRGYIGDSKANPIFGKDSDLGRAFAVVGNGYQRPFELATLRLQNMIGSLSNCTFLAIVICSTKQHALRQHRTQCACTCGVAMC
eukprot:TRINITY_DN22776_c0_g1_i3.p1 TRINITY_DN22776_c0_g1~~TRINITY_DN22776_c0_g1_i3.p1  ORF type:complete len:287 (-),score=19.22 TRINITY_DN22776_c0_g1_i3:177-968(-)